MSHRQLMSNVCSKIQVLLDRYNAFKKTQKQATVLNERMNETPL